MTKLDLSIIEHKELYSNAKIAPGAYHERHKILPDHPYHLSREYAVLEGAATCGRSRLLKSPGGETEPSFSARLLASAPRASQRRQFTRSCYSVFDPRKSQRTYTALISCLPELDLRHRHHSSLSHGLSKPCVLVGIPYPDLVRYGSRQLLWALGIRS